MTVTKIDVADIDGYDWNWSAKYLDEFVDELVKAYSAAFVEEFPDASIGIVQRESAEWARTRGATQIVDIANTTRDRVRAIVGQSIAEGQGMTVLSERLAGDHVFSPSRAMSIARTETATALGQGAKGAAKAQERDEKRWMTSGDTNVSVDCSINESDGWIPIGNAFTSGIDTVPQHPNCRCTVIYRTKELHQDSVSNDFRCSGCGRLLARNARPGTKIVCRHCKQQRTS